MKISLTVLLMFCCPVFTVSANDESLISQAQVLIKSGQTEKALPILYPLANHNNPEAMIMLGYYFLLEKKDEKKSLKWFRRGAKTGDPTAQVHLGLALTEVINKKEYYAEGVDSLIKAAKQGNKEAAMQLSSLYYTGDKGLPIDHKRSEYWKQKSKIGH